MTNSIKKFFQDLQGRWRLSRDIFGSHRAHATGLAVFETTTDPDELQYAEAVLVTLGNRTKFNAYQHYMYQLENENKLNVYFDGGYRLFHSVEFTDSENKLRANACHHCQADTYTTSYFFGDSSFEIEHRVNGPKKDYISRTILRKTA